MYGGTVSVVGVCIEPSITNPDPYPLTTQIYDLVAAQTGLFLGGGDQARIITAWKKTDGSGKDVWT